MQEKDYIFLNIHRRCGSDTVPLESFRLQKLLSAGQLVISEHATPGDEDMYRDLVTFANLTDVPRVYSLLANMSLEERRALASYRYESFARRFSANHLLSKAGAFALFHECFAPAHPHATSKGTKIEETTLQQY